VRLTVIGSGPAPPQPDTPASGLLVETGAVAVLLDCGPGVVARLSRTHDPRRLSALVVGHFHADHYLDLAPLRYLFPWEGAGSDRLSVFLPPGGHEQLAGLATAIAERSWFFEDAFEVVEFDPEGKLRIGDLEVAFVAGRHYVPAWGVVLTDRFGARIVYAGDTGPNDELVRVAAGADLLVCEATLGAVTEDEPERGHLTCAEALDHAQRARVGGVLLTHYPSLRRDELEREAASAGLPAAVARPGFVAEVVADSPVLFRPAVRNGRSGDGGHLVATGPRASVAALPT